MYLILVGHSTTEGALGYSPEYVEGTVSNALERVFGVEGATVLHAKGITKQWGEEDCSVVLLTSINQEQAEAVALEIGYALNQEVIGLISFEPGTTDTTWLRCKRA
jgi:hypothetical protein